MSDKKRAEIIKKTNNPSWESKLPAEYKHLDNITTSRRNTKFHRDFNDEV